MKVTTEKRRVIIELDNGAIFRIMPGNYNSIQVYAEGDDHGNLAAVGIASNVMELRCVNTDEMINPIMMTYEEAKVFYLHQSGDQSFDEDSDLWNEIEMQIEEGVKPKMFDILRDEEGKITHVSKRYMLRLMDINER